MSESTKIFDSSANPAPLGLLGFGMTTVLLNLHNAGFFALSSMVLAMGVFYGGMAQVFAGWMEWKKGNTFGTVAFTSYGLFWLTLVYLIVMPSWGGITKADEGGMIAYLFMWGLFTFVMWIAIKEKQSITGGILYIVHSVLAACTWRCYRKRSFKNIHRLGRNYLWFVRNLSCSCRNFK